MEFGVNDSLKSRAFGQKKDVMSKIGHIERVEQEGAKYYPWDSEGHVNEWGAIL